MLAVAACAVFATGAFADEPAGQERFKSPDSAVQALIGAAQADDTKRLLAIFGPDAASLVSSGDAVADAAARRRFAEKAREGTNLAPVPGHADMLVLDIGRQNWPLPIPLVKDGDAWRFDTAVGKEELINRRIGRDELHTLQTMRAYVDGQRDYASVDRGSGRREYAQKFHSDAGQHNGLYWPAAAGKDESPMGPFVAAASGEGYDLHAAPGGKPRPYQGYLFKILTAQGPHAPGGQKSYVKDGHLTGGFALVAWPASYIASGVMTFVVNQQGVVFQKNLGADTAKVTAAMTQYDPDDSWSPVRD